MFNKRDYRSYFNELARIEKAMIKTAASLKKAIPDAECQKLLTSLSADEKRHLKLASEIQKLFFKKEKKHSN